MDFLSKIVKDGSSDKQGNHQQQPSGNNELFNQFGKFVSGSNHQQQQQQQPLQQSSGSGSFLDKLHGVAGGGPESEKKEDALDKGIDYVQEKFLGKGPQNNENAAEQAKDKMIADAIRKQYQSATGKEFPVEEKKEKKSFGSSFGF